MDATHDFLTTGKVARLCGVAPRTAAQWIDSGRLKGHRIPGSKHRRVRRADLERFAADHGLPLVEQPATAAEATAEGATS